MKDIRWAVSDGVGYFFPTSVDVRGERQIRSGSWSSIGGPAQTPDASSPILSLYVDHGARPRNDRLVYAIVPRTDAVSMAVWAKENPIEILENDTSITAARDRRTSELGVIFWTAGSVEGVISDTPAILFLTPRENGFVLSIADPAGGEGDMRVTLPWPLSLETASPVAVKVERAAQSTTITLPRDGKTTSLQLAFASRSRGVRR